MKPGTRKALSFAGTAVTKTGQVICVLMTIAMLVAYWPLGLAMGAITAYGFWTDGRRPCPYCRKSVSREATICPYCRSSL